MFLNIGFGNSVNTDKIICMISPDSAPAKRLIQAAKDSGLIIDATQGRKTKAVIVMENNSIVLSALQPDTLSSRYHDNIQIGDEKDGL